MEFESRFGIGEEVQFIPMHKQARDMGIECEGTISGMVVAVRFTKKKVFYDIMDEYFGAMFNNVDSVKVFSPSR